ncbi:MAG TPA: type V CRISPR-associated protein Cas12a/Cpf1 [Edaphocola sp.]|nr:type V CRISPR-associated protein Cas12a/Cpf1 [Edaphocola sp.]
MKQISNFKHSYALSKTLRFELKPIGKTKDHIEAKGLLTQDEQRASSYKVVKKIIDEYHKYFIELAMGKVRLSKLKDFQTLYNASTERKKEESFKKELKKVQDDLRKEIVKYFKETNEFKNLFGEKLIKEDLPNWLSEKADKEEVEEFKTFTTYFTGFHENRKNMYSDKEQSTAIAYRLIHENLPKFLDNIKVFDKLKEVPELHQKCLALYKEIEEYLNIISIDEAFELDYYNMVLTQKQIDVYNLIIGGRTPKENETKIQGLNEYINLYNQKQKDKKDKIPKLKPLYKMILSDRESISFLQDKFDNSHEVLNAIKEYYHANLISFQAEGKDDTENVLLRIKELLADLTTYNLSQVYIRNDRSITDISQAVFGDFSIIKEAMRFSFLKGLEITKKGLSKKQEESLEKYLKQNYFSIAEIENALQQYKDENDALKDLKSNTISDYFKNNFKTKVNDKEYDLVANVDAKYLCVKGILENYPEDKKLNQEQTDIDNIKLFLDSLMLILHFVKPLMLPNDSTLEKDQNFYNTLEPYYKELQHLIPLYNKVRNFATQKAYNVEKFKLNFENKAQFLGGWVDSHTENSDNATQAGGYLFRKKNAIDEYDYYVGFSADTKLFRSHEKDDVKIDDKSEYERLDYYQLKSASVYGNSYVGTNINGICTTYENDKNALFNAIKNWGDTRTSIKDDFDKYISSQKGDNKPTPSGLFKVLQEKHSSDLTNLYNDINFKKTNQTIIDNLKNTILSLYRVPKSQDYKGKTFSLFTEPIEVIEQLAKEKAFSYFSVSKTEFEEACSRDEKPLFLFKINNKDLSYAETFTANKRKSRGRENLHTLYFKALMQGNQNVFDIGTGEVFFRKKSLDYSAEIFKNGHHINQLKEKFSYPIVSNRRFAYDKFQFHLSIIQNYQQPKNPPKDFDEQVLKFLKNNPDVNIIGLDRGERHLIYLTLINQKREILQQFSLNDIVNEHKGEIYKTGYKDLLDKKEKERAAARENWGTIENIKELKEGYISQVVHKIAKLMVEYNAIVVMEDLNMGFKRGRFKVEKQVYQKLEKMLIDKLNYLVFKDRKPTEAGGLYNALQLTNKFESFQKMGKQSGFLFYVPAWNTSKIDPTTGFVNLLFTKYESVEKAQKFFSRFDAIHFNQKENYFEFAFDYDNFTEKATGTQTKWTVCTHGERILTFRNPEKNNEWDNNEIKLSEKFENLLGKKHITYGDGTCIKAQIVAQNEAKFFKELMDLFKLTLQMRNSITHSEVDYLISPVKNAQGTFYDSRKADDTLPKDADANGAYHIAKKGLMWLNQIHDFEGEKWEDLKFENTNKGWLNFVQKNR